MEYAILSESGDRDGNEDYADGYVFDNSKKGCFVLCDGLGGHGYGEVASKFVVEEMLRLYREDSENTSYLINAFEKSQDKLRKYQFEKNAQNEMKTTAVLLKISDTILQWGHVGDSRLYYFQKGKLIQRTLDHSVPQVLVTAGEIKEKEIRRHPDRNRLLRVMGMEWSIPQYTLSEPIPICEKQAFLLCSDGFWELIEEKKMEKCLKKSSTPKEWLHQMEEIILKNGKNLDMDNYSAIAVFV